MFPGCEVRCRIIGVLKATQRENGKGNRNDRLVAVAEGSVLYTEVDERADLEPAILKQIEQFFANYQKVRNTEFKVIERGGARAALSLLKESSTDAADAAA
jgi:inorganic pyrophosphatase